MIRLRGRSTSSRLSGVVLLLAAIAAVPVAGQTRWVALAGAPNFRDIGGYATADGRHVRWRQVYRSGQLSQLTADDYKALAELGITVVCDFRNDNERAAAPTKWQGEKPPRLVELGAAGVNPAAQPRDLLAAGASADTIRNAKRESYTHSVALQTRSFQAVAHVILDAQGPVLFHCSGGADRTGMFSALLLTMLGVSRAEVLEDYQLTNRLATPRSLEEIGAKANASAETVRAVNMLLPDYLDAFFLAIDREYGSLDAYRRNALNLSDADLLALKARLLDK